MKIHRIRNYTQYLNHVKKDQEDESIHKNFIEDLLSKNNFPFYLKAYSYTASKESELLVDLSNSVNGMVNWREILSCPITHLNNRMRAACHLFDIEVEPYNSSKIYITEQLTPMYKYFKEKFPFTTGSEFLGGEVPFGSMNSLGLRNEDLTRLTMKDDEFDVVISFDVFEHIPNYINAFSECYRVLNNGGRLFWTVPFSFNSEKNIINSVVTDKGLQHFVDPQYHWNPTTNSKILCFQTFGWQMFEEIKTVGFKDVYAIVFRSTEFGYLGFNQAVFVAIK
jgi:SAM-dependent methyltransferase